MSFTYTTGIPAAANNPSTDQPNMQQNTNAINNLINVDHMTFNQSTAGQHKQITFNAVQASPAIPAGAEAVEYINTQTGGMFGTISSLFFKNATRDLPLTNLILTTTTPGATGFGVLTPWGLILNFGFATVVANPLTVTFQVAMNNNQYSLLIGTSSSTASRNVTTQSFGATTFDAYATNANTGFYFLAIGR